MRRVLRDLPANSLPIIALTASGYYRSIGLLPPWIVITGKLLSLRSLKRPLINIYNIITPTKASPLKGERIRRRQYLL
jgi:hypothetical protein